jgi:hypothetical protein
VLAVGAVDFGAIDFDCCCCSGHVWLLVGGIPRGAGAIHFQFGPGALSSRTESHGHSTSAAIALVSSSAAPDFLGRWSVSALSEGLSLYIRRNGRGLDPDSKAASQGLGNTCHRTLEMKAYLRLVSVPDRGPGGRATSASELKIAHRGSI